MSTRRIRLALSCLALLLPTLGQAQATATTPAPAAPALNFSGLLVGSFQYRTDKLARATNRFDLDRAYLNFRLPVGDRTSIRVTTDVYQQQTAPDDAYYRGWTIRAKYAYLQHEFYKAGDASAYARIGMLNTVIIEHIEGYWPRWMSQVAIERAGYFSSADMGLSATINMPRKLGEVAAVITNGPGYTSRERDRFKDYAGRVSLTPLSSSTSALMKSLIVSAWGYKGALASRFVAGGAGQVGPVNEGMKRDRYGVFTAVRDPRFTLGLEWSRRMDEREEGNNTPAVPRAIVDSTANTTSGFAVLRPLRFLDAKSTTPLGLVARWDKITANNRTDPYDLYITGVTWDLTRRTTVGLDYQVRVPEKGALGAENKTMFFHFVASF